MLVMSSTYLQVFFDADCGFCAHSASVLRRLDRRRRLSLVPLQRAAEVVPDAPPIDALLESMHVRDQAGRWIVGGAAWLRIADEIPLLRPLEYLARLPGFRSLVEPTYALVARNRHRISRLLGDDACSIPQAR
jgi:predicted DCC family thiol-disulfide oxidoreductase YuxK